MADKKLSTNRISGNYRKYPVRPVSASTDQAAEVEAEAEAAAPVAQTAQDLIDEQYANLLKAQTEQLNAETTVNQNNLNSQLAQSDATYQPLRNEAYVNTALAERARKENMANMGLSGEGGTSLSLQQRNTGNLLSTLGDISRGQQSYEDEINLALTNLQTTNDANLSSVTADIEAQRIAAQLSQMQFDQSYALSERQQNLTEESAAFDQFYSLYRAGWITKQQFEEATKIDLR